jgi:hypothetical protein
MLTSMVLLAATLCGQIPSPTAPAREWQRISQPGPSGDYFVWGWKDGLNVRYQPEEQAAARQALQAPAKPPVATASALANGVETAKLNLQHAGTFETNDPNFKGDKFVGDAAAQRCDPYVPPAPESGGITPTHVVVVLVAAFLLLYGFNKRRE